MPGNWQEVSLKLRSSGDAGTRDAVSTVGVVFGDESIIASLRETVEDSDAPSQARRRALQLLLEAKPRDFNDTLRSLVSDRKLALEAIRGLAQSDDPKAPATILRSYRDLTPDQKAAAINTLASRVLYARALIQYLETKQLSPNELSAFQARQLIALGDESISKRVRELWGDARQTSEDKRELISDLRTILTPQIAAADLKNGRALFTKHCAACHVLFGEGTKIGPDLTGSDRKNLDYLLENIIDPSAIVGAEFRSTLFILSDGRVVNGIIREQNDKTVTIETPDGPRVVDRQDIEQTSVSDKSMMPDGILQPLSNTEIRDMLSYIMSN